MALAMTSERWHYTEWTLDDGDTALLHKARQPWWKWKVPPVLHKCEVVTIYSFFDEGSPFVANQVCRCPCGAVSWSQGFQWENRNSRRRS